MRPTRAKNKSFERRMTRKFRCPRTSNSEKNEVPNAGFQTSTRAESEELAHGLPARVESSICFVC